jgi:hypothetical protein
MQTKQSNIWAVKEEPESNIVVLDEAALDEANGGVAPLLIAAAAAGGFAGGVGAAFGVAWLVKHVF